MGMENLGGTPAPSVTGAEAATATPSPEQGQAPPLPNNPFAEITLEELGLSEAEEGPPETGEQVLSKSNAAKSEPGSPGDAEEADEEDEPEEPEGEAGEETEDEPPSKAEFEHPKFQKRVDRLTAARKAAEERAAAAEAKVKELEAAREQSAPVDDPADPVWRLKDAQDANRAMLAARTESDAAQAFLDRIEDGDLDGVVADLKGHGVKLGEWDRRTVTRALQRYHASQSQELATRTAELTQIRRSYAQRLAADRQAYDAAAAEHFTWLSDKSDPRTEKVERLLKVNPMLGREAVGKFAAAALVKELTRYQKAKAQVTKPLATKKRDTTLPGAAQGAPPPKPANAAAARAATADKRFQENPDEDSMTEWIAANVPGMG